MYYPDELDKWFSIYVRVRFADQHTGMVHCYTCTEYRHWKHTDCGHFERRGHWALRYEPNNARGQCVSCNRDFSGKYDVFEEELRAELGDKAVDELQKRKGSEALYDDAWYIKQIAYFKAEVKKFPAYK